MGSARCSSSRMTRTGEGGIDAYREVWPGGLDFAASHAVLPVDPLSWRDRGCFGDFKFAYLTTEYDPSHVYDVETNIGTLANTWANTRYSHPAPPSKILAELYLFERSEVRF